MKRILALAMLAATASAPASAIVKYTFSNPAINFTYLSASYINMASLVDAFSLAQCQGGTSIDCESVNFYNDLRDIGAQTDFSDALKVTYDHGNASSYYYFTNGALGRVGQYIDGGSTLTVSRVHTTPNERGRYALNGPIGDVLYLAPHLITGTVTVPVVTPQLCSSDVVDCSGVTFVSDLRDFGSSADFGDAVVVSYNHGNGSSYFYFGDLTLQTPGSYVDTSGYHTLTVAAVPEPASWALLIGGFGLTAAAMRRRQPRFSVVTA